MLTCLLVSTALQFDPVSAGRIDSGGPVGGLVVAAPHGGFDLYTDEMASQAAKIAGAGFVVANGYRTRVHPWNVNRPTAGVGLAPDAEVRSPEAALIFGAWMSKLESLRPKLYVEIHGNSRKESAEAIEVAAKGIAGDALKAFQDDFVRREQALPEGCPHLPLAVEGFQPIHFRAEGSKHGGAFSRLEHGLQMELPIAIRKEPSIRRAYAKILGESLPELAKLIK